MSQSNAPKTADNYQSALDFLYQFVNYERKMTDIYAPEKMDPFRPAQLLYAAGDPQRSYPSIHIAGTKGKGSVAAMCAAALSAAGYRVGLYTSPHLQELRERIRVLTADDAQGNISEADFVRLVNRLRQITETMAELTWFELLTAIAFIYFAQQEVDVAVVEVGLGGRLDATNVLMPVVAAITSLSLDHTGLLGDTVAQIAAEKGGIIKHGVPLVCAPQKAEALAVIERIAAEHMAPLILIGDAWRFETRAKTAQASPCARQAITVTKSPGSAVIQPGDHFELALRGAYQGENAVMALATLEAARPYLPALSAEAMARGLSDVVWPGRLQLLHQAQDQPALLVDGAHNADSAQKLAAFLHGACRYERLWLILGVTADKNVPGILQPLLPLASGTFVTMADNPRATEAAVLQQTAAELGYEVRVAKDIEAALVHAWRIAGPADLICVAGSLYIVGDLLNRWDTLKSQLLSVAGQAS